MSNKTLSFTVVSSQAELQSGDAEMIIAHASHGDLGLCPGHAPLLAELKPGPVRVINGTEETSFYVSGGIIEVQPNSVSILADTAIRAADLNEAEIVKAKEEAEQLMKDNKSSVDYARLTNEIAQAAAKLRVLNQLKNKIK